MDRSEMESLGEKEIRTRLDKGDLSSVVVRWRVRRWLSARARAERQARIANIIATIALIAAIAGNHDKITSFITALLLRYL